MLKALVFDFDGVLVDTEPLHYRTIAHLAGELGQSLSFEQYLDRYVGYDDRDVFRVMLFGRPGPRKQEEEARVTALTERKGDLFAQAVSAGVPTFPGGLELVREAHRVVPLAIASGATRRDIELTLGPLGILGCFDPIVTADDVPLSKPDPTTYRRAVEGLARRKPELALATGDCLAIEDTATGIEAARRAGLMTLGVATTSGPDKLRQAQRVVKGFEGLTMAKLREWYG